MAVQQYKHTLCASPPPLPQAWLSKYIHKLRAASTKVTDERVRLTGEVISGALAMKVRICFDTLWILARSAHHLAPPAW